MSIDIKIPTIGESIKEARILRWIKQDGEYVKADEPVVELESDKASDSIPAPAAGIVRIGIPADRVVAVGAVIGQIDVSAQAPVSREAPPSANAPSTKVPSALALSPAAQRIVAEEKLDPSKIAGTGRDGRIIKEDVIAATESSDPKPETPNPKPQKARNAN